MLYLYESTKLSSVVACRPPPPRLATILRSSMAWKTASCVMLPSLSVSRFGAVTPLLVLPRPDDLRVLEERPDLLDRQLRPTAPERATCA